MKRLLTLIFLLTSASSLFAQQSEIQGKVTDKKNGMVIELATVKVLENGVLKTGANADLDGFYSIKPIRPGKYDIEVSFVNYNTTKITGVEVFTDKITFLDFQLEQSGGKNITEVVIKEYKRPLLKQDETATGGAVTKEEISNLPTKNITSIASTTAGVYQKDEGGGLNVRGGRGDATDYYVDGVKVSGTLNIPASAIEQLSVITGGLPARYGDATGGIVSITLRGASAKFGGGAELVTSKLLDAYDHRFASVNLTGPILKSGKKDDTDRRTILGYFINAEYQHDGDPSPSAAPLYVTKDDVIDSLRKNPLSYAPDGSGIVNNYSFITKNDMKKIKARPNVAQDQLRFLGRLDFALSKNTEFSLGANFDIDRTNDFADTYMLFNSENNSQSTGRNYRVYGRFTQRFPGDTSSNSVIKNAYYTLQADYSVYSSTSQSKFLKDRIFEYGYVGKFQTYRTPFYVYGNDSKTGFSGYRLVGYFDTLTTFEKGEANPYLADLTEQYYSLAGNDRELYSSVFDIQNNNGMINGSRSFSAQSAYSIWYIAGRRPNNYSNFRQDQFRMTAQGSIDIKPKGFSERNKHALEFGVEYEQRVERNHSVGAATIWSLMRQLTNDHIRDLDSNAIFVFNNGVYQDTINYLRKVDENRRRMFDLSLREKLGLNPYGLDYIDIDAVDPSLLSLDMFSPDDLLNEGSPSVNYYGFNYDGSVMGKRPSFDDFFKKKMDNGYFARPIDAFRPIYTAAYIQDKFSFKDLIFNIGVRFDRFDANQKVLRDPYSLYGLKTVNEVNATHPSNVGEDWAVYGTSDGSIIYAYRDGDDWYDAQGNYRKDPTTIASNLGLQRLEPILDDPTVDKVDSETNIKGDNFDVDASFEDFKPIITASPRIAFSFPITQTEEGSGAMFFAHYDVLSQRPQSRNFATPDDYYFLFENQFVNNPNLKPEKMSEYQLGFKQKVGNFSALTMSLFYREYRNQIQLKKMLYAYPRDYNTFSNSDFSTIKGFEVGYDMRRIGNAQLRFTYTLQFADGTGSSDVSQSTLVNAGQPNLKVVNPLDIDSRNSLTATLDYRYDEGDDYNGPMMFGKQILANAGLNLVVRARSGEPFTRTNNPVGTQLLGDAGRTNAIGSINGSRLPWNYRMDLRIDKDFRLQKEKDRFINAYILIQNLLNTKNINGVYSYTGNPDDDGYLSAPENQSNIENSLDEDSFRDLYSIKVNAPGNYSIPRRIRLGIQFNF